MKISVIGGGPGGLYFALLTKKARPEWQVELFEQNQPDDTFGFGVVFSDETLHEFLSADPESLDAISREFAYWDDIVVHKDGQRTVIGGNGFAGFSRSKLLAILQHRAEAVGVVLHHGRPVAVDALETLFADSDMIVAADGINSPIRERFADQFGRSIEYRHNYFTWMGSTRPLDAFTFFFKRTDQGYFCAHTYQYEKGRSTWILECTAETWHNSGFAHMDEEQSARYLEQVFAEELDGHGLITNRSIWRNFPRVHLDRWSHGKIAILGDAKASAHWSIGSGTKLAMECAVGLSRAVVTHGTDVDGAFAQYEADRRLPVGMVQHGADVSLRWFEHMDRYWDMPHSQFVFSLMTRSKAITWDNLKLRDEKYLEQAETDFYQRLHDETGFDCRQSRPTPMFTPFRLRDLVLENRVVVSAMAQYSAQDGLPDDWHLVHLGSRATGGAGLVMTEMTCISPEARITPGCTGLWNDSQEAAWKRIVDFIHGHSGAAIGLQLGHAGRKGSTCEPWQGGGIDQPLAEGNWPLVSASPVPYLDGVSQVPAALDRTGMERIRHAFAAAAERGARAGFDLLQLHFAHGYLLASFLSPLTNRRDDQYGGSIDNRLRFPLEVFHAVRAMWPEEKPLSIRISAWDWTADGLSWEDLVAIGRAFKQAGVDLIDVSTGETVKDQVPLFGRMWQTPFADFIRNEVGIPTVAVGAITLPEQINTIIAAGRADLCALARPHLNNPSFTRLAAGHYGARVESWPVQYRSAEFQLYREAERADERQTALMRRARLDRSAYVKAKT